MAWEPADYDGSCAETARNQSVPLTFLCFLVQYFAGSNDEILEKIYPRQDANETDFDFIVVGAGAAGCVVANRLTEESNWKVLLLEAGGEEPRVAGVPKLTGYLHHSSIEYDYYTNDTKAVWYEQGKVMGGTHTVSGQVYNRGSQADYDGWASDGNHGWSWKDVLPYFKKSENFRDPEILANFSKYHGTGGYLTVEPFPYKDDNVTTFINAFKEAGLNHTDLNKGDQIGVSRLSFTIVHGARLSSNAAFVRPIRGKRSNLFVRPNARVSRIIIDAKTKRTTGVEYETNGNKGIVKKEAYAKKEVIISTGFINSPKLLMLSGIGPKNDLQHLNITVIKDLPVGHNLKNHVSAQILLRSNYVAEKKTKREETRKANIIEWINTHEGLMSTRQNLPVAAFYQTKFENRSGAADIQFEIKQDDYSLANVSINAILLQPKSSGTIKLDSVDPLNVQPEFKINPLSDSEDVEVLVEGLKFARKVAKTQALSDASFKMFSVPEPVCKDFDFESDDYLRCLINNTVKIYRHGAGTCKMGPTTDKTAVVDPTLKVHGIDGLRVIDASIMPMIVRSNLAAPIIMIGEKGSDMIKKDWLK